MHSNRVSLSDRRRYADATTKVRLRVLVAVGLIGVVAWLLVRTWGNPRSRADETIVLITTVLVLGLAPGVEWVLRFGFARVSTLSERLTAANQEIARLNAETVQLQTALHIEDFTSEGQEFAFLSAPFWERLERAFDQYLIAGVRKKPQTLAEMVESSPWPDQATRGHEPGTLDGVLATFASSIYPQYGFELIQRDRFPTFDAQRRNIRRRIRQWGTKLTTDQRGDVTDWLRSPVARAHSNTIKLAWYLEFANAKRTGTDASADYAYYRAIRDTLESGLNH